MIEIIYYFDFKKAFSDWRAAAAGTAASVLIFCAFWFDLGGYDTYLPEPERIESVGLSSYYLYDGLQKDRRVIEAEEDGSLKERVPSEYDILRKMNISDPDAVQAVLEIVREGIRNLDTGKKVLEQEGESSERVEPEDTEGGLGKEAERPADPPKETVDILIQYHLKNGGMATRVYRVDFLRIKDTVDRLYGNREFKRESYPVLKLEADEIAGADCRGFWEYSRVNIEKEALGELLETYQEEFYTLTLDEKREEAPLGYIQFKTEVMQETIDRLRKEKRDYTRFNDFAYYPVYPGFRGTIAILREAGTELEDCIAPEDVERIVIQETTYDEEEEFEPVSEPGIKLYRTDAEGALRWRIQE